MSNTLLTTDLIVRDAAIILQNNLVAANLINRGHENEFKNKVGDTIRVKVPPIQEARDLNDDGGTTQANDITEVEVDLELTRWPYIRHTITSKEQTLELDDFNEQVTMPAVLAIRDEIDAFFVREMVKGFAPYKSGTSGTSPTTVANLVAGRKVLQDNGCPSALRRGILDTTAEAALLQLDQFTSADYGGDAPAGLKEAILNRRYGIDWFADQNCGTQDQGDIAGTVLTDGTPVLAASTLHVDGFTAATGTVKKGTRFTVAGDTTIYTTTADATLAGNETDLPITPVVTAALVAAGDGAAVTFETALAEDIIFHRDAFAGAVVAPLPLMNGNSSAKFFNGIGIRVTMDGGITNMSNEIVFDTFVGGQTIQPKAGVVVQG